MKLIERIRGLFANGGKGSGNWGHKGRPGQRGGSDKQKLGPEPVRGYYVDKNPDVDHQEAFPDYDPDLPDWFQQLGGFKTAKEFIREFPKETFGSDALVVKHDSTLPPELNGIGFAPVEHFIPEPDKDVGEPPLPPLKGPIQKYSAGILMQEPDGRIWVFEPKNHFAGYRNSLSKGTLDPGESPQAAAQRELWEETGLTGSVDGYLGDFETDGRITRFYSGRRTGGDPRRYKAAETHAIKLLSPKDAFRAINMPRDRAVLRKLMVKNKTAMTPEMEKDEVANEGQPCGDSFISGDKECHVGEGKITLPKPPQFATANPDQKAQNEAAVQQIQKLAQEGKAGAIKAFAKTSPSPKVQAYAQSVVKAMAGEKADPLPPETGSAKDQLIAVTKQILKNQKKGSQTEGLNQLIQGPPKDGSGLMLPPQFLSSNPALVKQNSDYAAKLYELAKAGDKKAFLVAIKDPAFPPSPKLKAYAGALATNLGIIKAPSKPPGNASGGSGGVKVAPIGGKAAQGPNPAQPATPPKDVTPAKIWGEGGKEEARAKAKATLAPLLKSIGISEDQAKAALTQHAGPKQSQANAHRIAIVESIMGMGLQVEDAVAAIQDDPAGKKNFIAGITSGPFAELPHKQFATTPLFDLQCLGGIETVKGNLSGSDGLCKMATREIIVGDQSMTGTWRHELGHALHAAMGVGWGGKNALTKTINDHYKGVMEKAKATPTNKKMDHDWYETKYGVAGSRGLDNAMEDFAEHYRLYQREFYRDLHEGGKGAWLAQYRQRHPEMSKLFDAHYTAALLGQALS